MACAFQQLNFQKCAENGVLLPFWLPNVLPATTACTFSAPQLPKELWTWQFFNRFDFEICFAPQQRALFQQLNFQKWSKNGVFFNILTSNYAIMLPNVLSPNLTVFHRFDFETCNFSSLIWPDGSAPAALASLLFDPSEPQNIGKTKCSATFLPFCAAASSFFWLFLFSQLLFSAFLLPRSSHLCFSSVYIVGRVSSKLPSIIVRMSKIGGKYLRNSSLVCLTKHMSKDSPQNY